MEKNKKVSKKMMAGIALTIALVLGAVLFLNMDKKSYELPVSLNDAKITNGIIYENEVLVNAESVGMNATKTVKGVGYITDRKSVV